MASADPYSEHYVSPTALAKEWASRIKEEGYFDMLNDGFTTADGLEFLVELMGHLKTLAKEEADSYARTARNLAIDVKKKVK